ncbi:hypothetical protein [Corallococcus llansteffanensis]|uniref:Uncharacterized protein n=1 Tax=Corallococcus llansteffanensis TaxID=2316731 RepID=A0A3A8PU42_9BACT|nr:hypothetical protein [Corallococcus llansteffanensis]RKH58540.1 hypothetical protein D7V93_16630 [Corallococcus llansteffanensis]
MSSSLSNTLRGPVIIVLLLGAFASAGGVWRLRTPPEAAPPFDPLAQALEAGSRVANREAPVPSMCYTKTAGVSNPCWTCHTGGVGDNVMADALLQAEYAFSDVALTNHWTNLFTDRVRAIASRSDEEVLEYIREDNATPLRAALLGRAGGYKGWVPDLDLGRGFDGDGFARDGSGWRAVRYKPFPGTFWPTNGNTDDVFIRLPEAFRKDARGQPSRDVYRFNLAVLEAAMTVDPGLVDVKAARRRVEPVDERVADVDLDGDGRLSAQVEVVRGLPVRYAGAAADVPVRRYTYPRGTEFLHTVRYVDPDAPALLSTRLKELRYSRKDEAPAEDRVRNFYAEEQEKKRRGRLPAFQGTPELGLINEFGWRLQGFIEDAQGRLRLQTLEEHVACMGCHTNLGVTVDQTFAFPRKVPGSEGWRQQDLRGISDVPQAGHAKPETATYFERVQGGDEFRANDELLARFFPGGVLDLPAVRRAAPEGDRDLAWLLTPSRERALQLDKAYWALVREQAFALGRDTLLAPPANVHRAVENGSTELEATGRLYADGRLHLAWE